MSIHPLNDIKDFWSTKKKFGFQAFRDVMSRNQFQLIRESLAFQPIGCDPPDQGSTMVFSNGTEYIDKKFCNHCNK